MLLKALPTFTDPSAAIIVEAATASPREHLETHETVFTWMLQRIADAGLVKGKTVGAWDPD